MRKFYVYIIAHHVDGEFSSPVKIGYSANPDKRIGSLRSGNPKPIAIYHRFATITEECARGVEKAFHHYNQEKKLEGEWFDIPPADAFQLVADQFDMLHGSLGFRGMELQELSFISAVIDGGGFGYANKPEAQ